MGRKILLGFAGPGKASHNNVKDLLKDYLNLGDERRGRPTLPDDIDEVRVVVPAADDYLTDTVLLLLEWADDYAKFPYEAIYDYETDLNAEILDQSKKEIEARNVGAALIDRLVEGKKNGDEVALIVSWGEEGDDRTEMLVDLALAKDLPVKAIDQGLDDLSFGDDPEPEPEPEKPTRRRRTARTEDTVEDTAEPVEEEPARPRRGKPRKTAETSPAPAEAAETESVEEEASLARQAFQEAQEAQDETSASLAYVVSGSDEVAKWDLVYRALTAAAELARLHDTMTAAMNGTEVHKPSPLSVLLDRALLTYARDWEGRQESEEPAKPRGGRPRSDGTPARTRTPDQRGVKEWLNSDGEWVKAGRGRLRKNVKTRTVDPKTGEILSED